ncbi:arsinothricin resistance N-acetyltransferase ArsN1 family B [Sphingomonas lenta]|uniref:GNAT family N-acetyltransferase n=1 Tax=Sphingomonas lenta TaxID=1141887 RepID=A0A2A2SD80_9SPHN|nr:arsinothricin resistance N-acetyltransferase ArsN1 family B [Sphingomonas lenta]PAX07209.1 GNAT family N-acetyltransferase [Sphingomonas lenta]
MTIVRPARPDDAAALAAIYAPYVTDGVVSFELEPPDAAEMARRMAAGGDRHPWLVAEADGAVCGYAYASPFRTRAAYAWAVETTVYVAADVQGRGCGRALYAELLDRLTRQGFTQAVGIIALPNEASVGLHKRLGFRFVGVNEQVGWKHGRWIDVGVWQRPLAEPGDPPRPPRPFR